MKGAASRRRPQGPKASANAAGGAAVLAAATVSVLVGAPIWVLSGHIGADYALLSSTVAAYLAGCGCVVAARGVEPRIGAGWLLLGAGALGWGLGNTYWTWNELVAHAKLFPSPADYGFLLFPLLGAVGLWLLSGSRTSGVRLEGVLDGLIVTASLLMLSWIVTLRTTYQAGGDTRLAFVVSLAYPCGDLVLATMAILLAVRTDRGDRGVLVLVLVCLGGMTIADTLFAITTADGTYASGAASDAGWTIGFAALATAGPLAAARRRNARAAAQSPEGHERWRLLIPYVPFGVVLGLTIGRLAAGRRFDAVELSLLVVVFALVTLRQLLTLRHNGLLTEQLRHQAFHDPLTGLANRALFTDRLERGLAQRAHGGPELVAIYVDLDDFKLVNDTVGHDVGDQVLREVAERLLACCRPSDTVARLGGDEFVVLVEDEPHPETLAQRILEALEPAFRGAGRPVSASIGVASSAGVGRPLRPEDLLKQVDLALYAAKGQGKRTFAVFEPVMREHFDEEMAIRLELARALEDGALNVVHQPIYRLADREIVGAEALARWNGGPLGEVGPATFIPVAERADLILPLGQFVLDQACAQFHVWSRRESDYVSVNVSPLQLLVPEFPDFVLTTLARHRMSARQLVLEVTETVLVDESEIAHVLAQLRSHGVRIAIDDFGAGYASLRYLHRFPVDIVKIDRSYVRDIATDPGATRLFGSLVQMLSTLELACVAEGVETPEQAQCLLEVACPYSQGFLFSRPVPAELIRGPGTAPATARQPGHQRIQGLYSTGRDR